MLEKVKRYYENYDEEGRLFRDNAHMIEYLTTIRYFDRLIAPNSRILDACAGAGRYSFYLANKGHNVTACDLVEHNVNIMKSNPSADKLPDIRVCNVLDLSQFENSGFDVVLCMGALYHLWMPSEKQKAAAECVRVCKPGGLVALAYITRIGSVLASLNAQASNIDVLINGLDNPGEGVFVGSTPYEVEDIAIGCGLEKVHNIGTDGLIYATGEKLNAASEEDFQKYIDFHYSACEDQSIIGASLHGLWIGRKP